MSKYIFVMGGVISSLGKGVLSASIGVLLKKSGYDVDIQKVDPYLNCDSGTLSPYEHGECYVTEDGVETDLDLGNYERFLDIRTTKNNIITGGNVYKTVIQNERSGRYLGKTVQLVPHVTDEIKKRFRSFEKKSRNLQHFVIIEIGGTIGDIESLPFVEAVRQFKLENNSQDILVLHLTWVPYIETAKELKTKPAQHSIKNLLSLGIQPDIIICRSQIKILSDIKNKIAFFSNLNPNSVLGLENVDLVYKVPNILLQQNILNIVSDKMNLNQDNSKNIMNCWTNILSDIINYSQEIKIAIIGKYSKVPDSYLSIKESLLYASISCKVKYKIVFIDPEIGAKNNITILKEVKGILVAPGFGIRGIEGKIAIIKYARENQIPFLGICLGMHCALIELARNVLGIADANSEEFTSESKNLIITKLSQNKKLDKEFNFDMHLGKKDINIIKDTKAYLIYGQNKIYERFRHKYHFNKKYQKIFELDAGAVFSGFRELDKVTSMFELKSHPFFIGVQFHAEFNSFFNRPNKLFLKFIEETVKN